MSKMHLKRGKPTHRSVLVWTSSTGLPKWKQSPIDLSRSATWPKKFPPLYLSNYWSGEGKATMTNTGRTVQIELSDRQLPWMRGGPLGKDEYQFMNVQFRWGPDNSLGAEHSIDGIWLNVILIMDQFRSLYDGRWKNILGNCRPQQRLQRRRILFATDDAVA
ncbi:carbonic anhydrase 7-like [Ceratina calcarata]|uniref:Carbonic anhydrase 7-like n=1 Tax=Ceratina calcarata TaxID=156304 RepID=A0AAJ7WBY1_9HYME|nr:carbonic anhydrase 7-like [Ceratina calcarata]